MVLNGGGSARPRVELGERRGGSCHSGLLCIQFEGTRFLQNEFNLRVPVKNVFSFRSRECQIVHSFIKVPGNHFRKNKELIPQAAIVKRTSGLVSMITLIVGF